jgi:carboxymethylenebutenolidase
MKMGKMVEISTLDGSGRFRAYRANPNSSPRGAIVVIQEIFGLNPGIRARCDRWAENGYLAVALDLFWRDTPNLNLDPDVPEQLQQAFGHYQKFDKDLGIQDLEATIRYARTESGGRVGVVGYCLGGMLTYLCATRTDTDASVAYYGGGIDAFLGESHAIARPILLHFAEQDHFIPSDTIALIKKELGSNPHAAIHTYPGVDHGFATESGKRRVADAAELADSRTAAFFAEHIG